MLGSKSLTELSTHSERRAAGEEPGAALASIERAFSAHPKTRVPVQVAMVAVYLVLIVVPPWLPAQNRFVGVRERFTCVGGTPGGRGYRSRH
ncbi:MAG TPA: hypothetical protein VKP30_24045 [Polyangiaceae bacterium]|nr:hypothetical protein [Polyangiaceae bacterium]